MIHSVAVARYFEIMTFIVISMLVPIALEVYTVSDAYVLCVVYFAAAGVVAIILISFFPGNRVSGVLPTRATTSSNALRETLLYFAFTLFALAALQALFDFDGLNRRELAMEDSRNFNENLEDFVSTTYRYFIIAAACGLVGAARRIDSKLLLFGSAAIGAFLLASTGTRWVWLLAASPILVRFWFNSSAVGRGVGYASLVIASFYIVMTRSEQQDVDFYTALLWDLPSFESANVISTYPSDGGRFIDFVNGQILVLIPRFVWASKPIDTVVITYMVDSIGSAFDAGSNILPGFLGSAWLYGGYFGVIVLSTFYALGMGNMVHLIARMDDRNATDAILPCLVFVALILQVRGISVFYFAPALVYFAIQTLSQMMLGILRRQRSTQESL